MRIIWEGTPPPQPKAPPLGLLQRFLRLFHRDPLKGCVLFDATNNREIGAITKYDARTGTATFKRGKR